MSCCGFDPSASAIQISVCGAGTLRPEHEPSAIRRQARLQLFNARPNDQLHRTPDVEAVEVDVDRHACERQPVARPRDGWRIALGPCDLDALGRAVPSTSRARDSASRGVAARA